MREIAIILRLLRKYQQVVQDRKSTRLNSSHSQISYAVFCLKKKKDKLAAAFHELNAWDLADSYASSTVMVCARFKNRKELTYIHLNNHKYLHEMRTEIH